MNDINLIAEENIIDNSTKKAEVIENKKENLEDFISMPIVDDSINIANTAKQNIKRSDDKNIYISDVYKREDVMYRINISVSDVKDSSKGRIDDFLKKAYIALKSNAFESAIYFYKQALKENKKNYNALFGLATTYQMLLQYDRAIDIYTDMIDYKYKDIKIINNLLISIANYDPKQAIEMLFLLNKKMPLDAIILAQIGATFIKIKDFEKGISFLLQSAQINSENPVVFYNLGLSYDNLEMYDYGKYFYEISLKTGLGSKVTNLNISQIKKRISELSKKIAKGEGNLSGELKAQQEKRNKIDK